MISQKEIDEWFKFPDEGHAPIMPEATAKTPPKFRFKCDAVVTIGGIEYVRLSGLAGSMMLSLNNVMGASRFTIGK